jgi:general secretion pathway protein D
VATSPSATTSSLQLSTDALDGIVGGVFGPEVPGSGQFLGLGRDIPAFGVIIQAVQNSSDANVVAEPHLSTADNQEALIEVGRNVPTPAALTFPGGAGGTGGLVPVQSIQREDVTLRVKITPHINDEDTVTMDVEMDNRDIESTDERLGVTTTKRRLKLDKIVAHDDQPIVLGGLVQEVERETVRQVPGLGSIPVIGWLFKRKQKTRQKVNLLMILVPHIIASPDDIRRVHERRTKERLEFLERETSFKKRDLPTNVNYRKKAGLLAAVDREARRMEEEEAYLRAAEAELEQENISGEIGMSPRVADEEEDEGDTKGKTGKPPAKSQMKIQPTGSSAPRKPK